MQAGSLHYVLSQAGSLRYRCASADEVITNNNKNVVNPAGFMFISRESRVCVAPQV